MDGIKKAKSLLASLKDFISLWKKERSDLELKLSCADGIVVSYFSYFLLGSRFYF